MRYVFILLLAAGCSAEAVGEPKGQGSDWPDFLGPRRDNRSTETGILTDWPEAGPPLVWQRELGTGYAIGTVSRGKLFPFDRYDDSNRLTCLDAKTGEEIWRFEYSTDYEDTYGYNNGPRCSPIVDGDRVYVFGQEGMLYVTTGDCTVVTTGDWTVVTTGD